MKWVKKGNIYEVKNINSWMISHAQCPTAIELKDRIRIYFSARDKYGESLPTFIDVSKDNPSNILYEHKQPVLEKGRKGTFDENGIIPSYIVKNEAKFYFYYAGWSRCQNVPYKNFTGLAISDDDGLTFKKYSEGPVIGMDVYNPLSATGPCIVKLNNEYRCIYSTGIDWIKINNKMEHTYLLRYASSNDGVNWKFDTRNIIEAENEFMAHCKPACFNENGIYHMWFSKRGSHNFRESGNNSYRLGYATSTDFISWSRKDDECGIDVSENSWDSDMICYPNIIKINDKLIMFYNGNGFGKSGFGYAELQL
ncbi:MAG: hypothetical protein ACK45I_02850 [Bacteroidota bacterium]|jgi:predicted GH43/DUF377 family glycosyl hydrolase